MTNFQTESAQANSIIIAVQTAIAARRDKERLSYALLSARSGIPANHLDFIEHHNIESLDFLSLYQIAQGLGCLVSDLFAPVELCLAPKRRTLNLIPQRVDYCQRVSLYGLKSQLFKSHLQQIASEVRMLRKRRLISCTERDQLLRKYKKTVD